MEYGMPRNDILVQQDVSRINQVRARIKVPDNVNLALYAPTFRADKAYQFELDPERTLKALKNRFGGKWILLYRAHYYLGDNLFDKEHILDVTAYDDMQELLLISNVLITDYSSSIWDFSLTNRPAFLFTPDADHYQNERAFYTPIEENEFIQQYEPYINMIDSDLILIAEKEGKEVGFVFCIPNFNEAKEGKEIKTVILKTIAVNPEYEYLAIGNILLNRISKIAREKGLSEWIFAFMYSNNTSQKMAKRNKADVIREYALYGKEI